MSKTEYFKKEDVIHILKNSARRARQEYCTEDARVMDACAKAFESSNGIQLPDQQARIDCLNRLRDAAYSDAVAHGLWEMSGGAHAYLLAARLILNEAHELYEAAFRLDTAFRMYPNEPDHEAITHAWARYCEELADVIIMSLSSCGEMEIDADMQVAAKMEDNHGRPWKHKEGRNTHD